MPAKLRCKSAVGNNQTKRKKPHQVKVPFLKFVIALWKGVLGKKKKKKKPGFMEFLFPLK